MKQRSGDFACQDWISGKSDDGKETGPAFEVWTPILRHVGSIIQTAFINRRHKRLKHTERGELAHNGNGSAASAAMPMWVGRSERMVRWHASYEPLTLVL
jgi:hypothetical protein